MKMRRLLPGMVKTMLLVMASSWSAFLLINILGNIILPPRSSVLPNFSYGSSKAQTSIPRVNIIFVHGLGSNPTTTWRKPVFVSAVPFFLVSWTEGFLPDDIPNMQAWYFIYDSTVYNDAPRKTIGDIADELLLYLSSGAIGHKLVFVVHSYGGIVVKEFEAIIRAASRNRTHSDLLRSIVGIIFLAAHTTPNQLIISAASTHGVHEAYFTYQYGQFLRDKRHGDDERTLWIANTQNTSHPERNSHS
ncbi:hypothetical protein EK21DRAFT_87828 [Setomelanomma holmii]|uniref:DUF676 domain-containing protein n=1 Tax=Setomelanomma holmii TaxID=210430 RepID=A0A9P4HC06_9PLEO|nr:hypothetical protein EK21DRAFT_87828 [Setomelanomma holmii]